MKQTRREFLVKSSCALSMVSLATQVEHFGLMSAMAKSDEKNEQAVPSDYRALVVVFWSGGNDGNNMIVPIHNDATISNYTAYSNARNPQGLAIQQNQFLPISVPRLGGLSYGLHPRLGPFTGQTNNGIHELWGLGKMAVVTNVGTLVRPMTKAQFQNNSIPKPYQLYSHSDQVSQAHGGRSDTQSFTGWGGRISDSRTQPDNPGGLIPMITSISGAQLFTSGQTTLPLAIAGAPTGLNNVLNPQGYNNTAQSNARLAAFNALRTQDLNHDVIAAASHITTQAMTANSALQTFQEVTATFPNTTLGNQLKQVARLIKKRTDLSINRQIFYCQIGGFDTHNGQVTAHENLMTQFSQAARAFYDEMIVQNLSDKVTLCTFSDFNRTFNPAGQGAGVVGTDHGWGNHMFVIGGAVTASDFYGSLRPDGSGNYYPTLVFNGPDDADSGTGARGRWIPTTANEQYAATLARWFGVPVADLPSVFPNINNFASSNLGFLNP